MMYKKYVEILLIYLAFALINRILELKQIKINFSALFILFYL